MNYQVLQLIGHCLAPLDQERTRILRKFDGPSDWDDFRRFCLERGVLNLVYAKLKHAGREDIIPPRLREKMSRFYMNIAIHNELKLKSAMPLTALLRKRGIPSLFIKGASMLLAGDYCDFGERITSDVDVIIDESHRFETNRIFSELGDWHHYNKDEKRPYVESVWVNKWGVFVEFHFRLTSLNGVPSKVSMDRLWSKVREVHSNGATALIPSREDRFIQTAIHFVGYHNFDLAFMLICIADIAHIAADNGQRGLDWGLIYHRLQKEKMLEHVMVLMEAANELLDFRPIRQGLEYMNSQAPGLSKTTRPMALSLLKTVRGPKLYNGRTAMSLVSRGIPLSKRARFLLSPEIKKSIKKILKKEHGTSLIYELRMLDIMQGIRHGKILLDWRAWGYFFELCRFYRRIGFYGHRSSLTPGE